MSAKTDTNLLARMRIKTPHDKNDSYLGVLPKLRPVRHVVKVEHGNVAGGIVYATRAMPEAGEEASGQPSRSIRQWVGKDRSSMKHGRAERRHTVQLSGPCLCVIL